MYLPMLSDKELITHAEQTTDPIVTSDLERELLKRLDRRLDEELDDTPLCNALDEAGVDRDDLPEIIKVLDEFCVTDASHLRQKLERADKFYDIASEAGDVIERLAGLVKETA